MKPIHLLLSTALLASGLAHAQSEVPNRISYQGIVSDGAALVGAGGAVNREVHFRIYDAATAGNVIYSETQTVTIAEGEFSVLIGAGSDIPGEDATGPGGTTDTSIADAFDGSGRFLGVTVDASGDGIGDDAEISPRQQIVTTAFAFRAKEAETVVDGSIDTLDLGDATVTLAKLATNAVNSSSIVDGSINTLDLNDASVSAAKLGSDVGLWDVNGADVYRSGGKVGIGTSAPEAALHIKEGDGGTTLQGDSALVVERGGNNWMQFQTPASNRAGVLFGSPSHPADGSIQYDNPLQAMFFHTGGTKRMWIDDKGWVGVGSGAPAFPFHVTINSPGRTLNYVASAYQLWNSNGGQGSLTIGARIDSNIMVAGIYVASDARIKEIHGQSNAVADLKTLGRLEVTDYHFKDRIANGGQSQKKLIAQQVESVYPQAVTEATDVVPDLFEKARIVDGWVSLDTDLKVGERVRLLGGETDEVCEVLEVADGRFRVDWKGEDGDMFVYGREVDDFRSVDYEAISMLNVSATQELHRRLIKSEEEVESLRGRLAELEARDRTREDRLTAIESMLRSQNETAPQTVSVEAR